MLPSGLNKTIAAVAQASVLQRGAISRVHSTLEQPLALAILLLIGLPLAMAFGLAGTNGWERAKWGAAAFVMGAALLFTASRGAYLILVPMLVTMIVLSPDRRARTTLIVATLAFVSIGLLNSDVRDTMSVYLLNLQSRDTVGASVEHRANAFAATTELLHDRPFLGFGPGTFSADQLKQNKLISDKLAVPVLDNGYLEFAAENGVVGVTALAVCCSPPR